MVIWLCTVFYSVSSAKICHCKDNGLVQNAFTHMHEEISSNEKWVSSRCLHLLQEILPMELVDLLNVTKYNVSLPTQSLREVISVHLWYVVLYDESQ